MSRMRLLWETLYPIWPTVVKALVFLGFHDFRQEYLLGRLAPGRAAAEMRLFLEERGFEPAILAWYDPGESFSLRRRDGGIFQHHIRLFADGEIRGHYEYAPEAHPWKHIFERRFEPDREFWSGLLGGFLTTEAGLQAQSKIAIVRSNKPSKTKIKTRNIAFQ